MDVAETPPSQPNELSEFGKAVTPPLTSDLQESKYVFYAVFSIFAVVIWCFFVKPMYDSLNKCLSL